MQSDAWFVEDIQRSHQTASERCGEVDALALSAAQRVRLSVQREVSQSHFHKESQSVFYLCEQSFAHGGIVVVEAQFVKPFLQVLHRHVHEVRDAHSLYPDVVCLLFQSSAVAFRTYRSAAVSAEHHAVLYLVLVFFQHLEEVVDAHPVVFVSAFVGWQTVPQPVFVLLRQFVVWFEDRELVCCRSSDEFLFPFTHFLSVPALHASVVYAER